MYMYFIQHSLHIEKYYAHDVELTLTLACQPWVGKFMGILGVEPGEELQ